MSSGGGQRSELEGDRHLERQHSEHYRSRDGERERRDLAHDRYDRDRDREYGHRESSRDYRERERSHDRRGHESGGRRRRLSPIPDFGNRKKEWTGWDNPVPRFAHSEGFYFGALPPVGEIPLQPGSFIHAPGTEGYQRQQLRLYVGNLPPSVVENDLLEFLNRSMHRLPPGLVKESEMPVLNVEMSNERNYCFVELRSADEATYMTALDGIVYKGVSLRIRRPREWQPTGNEPPLPQIRPELLGIISTTVEDSPNKIFIGGLPPHFNEADVKSLLCVIGPLRAFNLVRDESGNSKFAFCEYMDVNLTDRACSALNGRQIGDKKIIVQRSTPTVNKEAKEIMPPEIINRSQIFATNAEGQSTLVAEEDGGLPFIQNVLSSHVPLITIMNFINDLYAKENPGYTVSKPRVTPILVLLNVVDLSLEEWSDYYYTALMEDFKLETTKYGKVKEIVIPRPLPKEDKKAAVLPEPMIDESEIRKKNYESRKRVVKGYGRVFIRYETSEQSLRAQMALRGLRYDGRMIITSFTNEIPSP